MVVIILEWSVRTESPILSPARRENPQQRRHLYDFAKSRSVDHPLLCDGNGVRTSMVACGQM